MARTNWPSPTRKWLATQITAVVGLLTAWATAGAWNTTLTVALLTLVGQAAVGYLVPNQPTPGGIGLRKAPAPATGSLSTSSG